MYANFKLLYIKAGELYYKIIFEVGYGKLASCVRRLFTWKKL